MLGEYGEAWFYPDFLFARPPIELMGASGFLRYTYTEAGERGRSWRMERKSWGKSPGKICAWRFVTSSPYKHQTPPLLFYHGDITPPHPSITACCWLVAGMEEEF